MGVASVLGPGIKPRLGFPRTTICRWGGGGRAPVTSSNPEPSLRHDVTDEQQRVAAYLCDVSARGQELAHRGRS